MDALFWKRCRLSKISRCSHCLWVVHEEWRRESSEGEGQRQRFEIFPWNKQCGIMGQWKTICKPLFAKVLDVLHLHHHKDFTQREASIWEGFQLREDQTLRRAASRRQPKRSLNFKKWLFDTINEKKKNAFQSSKIERYSFVECTRNATWFFETIFPR